MREIVEKYAAWAALQPGVKDYYAEAEIVMKQQGTVRRAGKPACRGKSPRGIGEGSA